MPRDSAKTPIGNVEIETDSEEIRKYSEEEPKSSEQRVWAVKRIDGKKKKS